LIPLLAFLLAALPVGASGATQTNAAASDPFSASIAPNDHQTLGATQGLTSVSPLASSPMPTANGQNASQVTALDVPTQPGCYVEASPGAAWQPTACGTAPDAPNIPSTGPSGGASAQNVGNGNDEVAASPGTKIGSSVGSFSAISGLTSEVGGTGPAFPGSVCLSGNGNPNCYSLQLNTNTFSCKTTYTNSISTTCWEQFVSSNTGQLYIQYWLLGYCTSSGGSNCNDSPPFTAANPAPSFSCPSTAPPGGWGQSGGSCYGNGNSVSPPSTPATSLGTLSLSAYANYKGSGNDVIQLCISGGSCYSVTQLDNVLNLFQNWLQSEFNVFGDANGSQAVFNAGTSITVSNALTDQSATPVAITPSCANNGTTGESNNLFLGPCSASSSGILFTEASQVFSLSAPSDVTVLAGRTATYSVGVTLTQGTAAPVALSVVSGLPSGATPTFTPGSVTPTGSSTLTISTTPSVALGDYTFTIQGQFGVLVETITANLHIYDFAVGLTPSDQTVLRGTSAVYALTLKLEAGSSTTGIPAIGLAVPASPPDATFVLSASSITPTLAGCSISTLADCQSVTVTTHGPPTGSLGDFTFTVTGTDPSASGGSRSSSANLHIYDFVTSASPSDHTVLRGGSTSYTATLTLVAGSSTPPSISLGVAGLPGDSTHGFSPAAVVPTLGGATSTLTVTTGPTSVGDYPLTVKGTDVANGGSRSASSVNLHIYDFTVTAVPASLNVLTTGSNTYSVSVALVPGSSTTGLPTIALSLAGLPSGATGSYSIVGGTPGFTSTLTITTSSAPSGSYLLTITGTDARSPEGGARTASPTLVVLTPAEALALIINQVHSFQSSGVLNRGQANALTVKLDNAIDKLNSGQPNTACNNLNAFVNQVNAFVSAGILTPAEADLLLGGPLGVVAIMAAIPC
jgi:hypothetical protein